MSSPSTSAQSTGTGAATGRTASSVVELIGRTPLVRLQHFERETPGVELYAKAEWQNPGGSVKDRAALRMIAEGEASGRLARGQTIVDATSGNTGIAYAMIGAARGYKVKLCLPENASPERKLILRAFGAELVLTSPLEGTDGAIREVRRMVAAEPGRYFYPDQYSNDANWRDRRADRRENHPFCRRARHGRHVRGHGPGPAALQLGDQAHFVSARLAFSRAGRPEAHGVGDGSGHLRPDARR